MSSGKRYTEEFRIEAVKQENALPRLTHCKADLNKTVARSQIGYLPNQKNRGSHQSRWQYFCWMC